MYVQKSGNMDKIKAGYEHLKACASHDACEQVNCAYFIKPDELSEIICFLKSLISAAEQTEPDK